MADGKIKNLELHSSDIWMPIIWISSNLLLPILVNLISDFVTNKMKEGKAQVDVTIVEKSGEKERKIHYKGDVNHLEEIIEAFENKEKPKKK